MKPIFYFAIPLMLIACVEGNHPNADSKENTPGATTAASDNASLTNTGANSAQKGISSESPDGAGANGRGQLTQPVQKTPTTNSAPTSMDKPVPAALEEEIKRVLQLFAKQEIKVGGNEVPLEAEKASKLLTVAYMKNKNKVQTWEDFVNVLSNEPTTSGKPFFVVNNKREQIPLADFLNQLHKK